MDNWNRISEIFDRLVDLPEPERARRLDLEVAGDAELRQQLDHLLRQSGQAEEKIANIVRTAREQGEPEPAQNLGSYRLIRELGRGGMGAVWLAERADGEFQQTVAIKVVKFGLASQEMLRRFRHERAILSRLHHPNIAQLFDGGTTHDDMPFLVMEYVDGQNLLDYCKAHACSLPKRLDLFLTVCSAVQHAHSNLVIHRDLKPSNILVSKEGLVKLLDFGIAKLVAGEPDQELTLTGFQPFTPAYASPEQILGHGDSTASDIYSLGKILAQLLPQPDRDLDLTAIIEKATREEASARYATVSQLSDDIQNYLAGRPVSARHRHFQYVAGRFLRRYRWQTALAATLLLGTVGFAVWATVQNQRIQRERDRAENVSAFLRGLFASADPERNQGERVSTRDLLDLGAHRIRTSGTDPVTQVQLLETIGEAYFHLGLYDRAVPLLTEVLQRAESQGISTPELEARLMGWLAEAETSRGRRVEGDQWGQRAVKVATQAGTADLLAKTMLSRCAQLHGATKFADAATACRLAVTHADNSRLPAREKAAVYTMLGTALKDNNDLPGAEASLQKAIALSAASSSGTPSVTPAAAPKPSPAADLEENSVHAQASAELAATYFRQGRMEEAEKGFAAAVGFKRKLYPDGHLDLARTLNNHANTLASMKQFNRAIAIFGEAHPMYRRFLGPESSELASSLSNLAVVHSYVGDLDRASQLLREVIAMQGRTIGQGKLPQLASQIKLAAVLTEQRNYREAAPLLETTLASMEKLQPVPKVEHAYAATLLSFVYLDTGQAPRALPLATRSSSTLASVLKESHWMRQFAETARAGALIRTGNRAEGRKILQPILELFLRMKAENWRTQWALRLAKEAS